MAGFEVITEDLLEYDGHGRLVDGHLQLIAIPGAEQLRPARNLISAPRSARIASTVDSANGPPLKDQ